MNKSLRNLYLATEQVYYPTPNLKSVILCSGNTDNFSKSMRDGFYVSGLNFQNGIAPDPAKTPSAEGYSTVSMYLVGNIYKDRFLRNTSNITSTTVTHRNVGGGLVYPAVTIQVGVSVVWDNPPFFRFTVFWFNGVPGPISVGPYYTTLSVTYNDKYNEELVDKYSWGVGLYYYA